jgi:hypothetical protein
MRVATRCRMAMPTSARDRIMALQHIQHCLEQKKCHGLISSHSSYQQTRAIKRDSMVIHTYSLSGPFHLLSSAGKPPAPFNNFPLPHDRTPVADPTIVSPPKQSEYATYNPPSSGSLSSLKMPSTVRPPCTRSLLTINSTHWLLRSPRSFETFLAISENFVEGVNQYWHVWRCGKVL